MNTSKDGINSIYCCNVEVAKLLLIGEGRQGKVYFLPPDKVIKVFSSKRSCKSQLYILTHASCSKFFAGVYASDEYSIIMDYIEGMSLSRYLKIRKLSRMLSLQLVELIGEFEKLGFTRLDIRLSHILVQNNESIKIIDPRGSFRIIQEYPVLMLRGINERHFLGEFFEYIKCEYPEIYLKWKTLWDKEISKKRILQLQEDS